MNSKLLNPLIDDDIVDNNCINNESISSDFINNNKDELKENKKEKILPKFSFKIFLNTVIATVKNVVINAISVVNLNNSKYSIRVILLY